MQIAFSRFVAKRARALIVKSLSDNGFPYGYPNQKWPSVSAANQLRVKLPAVRRCRAASRWIEHVKSGKGREGNGP